jgi:hypothetical protein
MECVCKFTESPKIFEAIMRVNMLSLRPTDTNMTDMTDMMWTM